MSKRIVHVVGTGTIGEPLIGLLSDFRKSLGIDEVTFNKKTPLAHERAKVNDLLRRGAKLSVFSEAREGFLKIGITPDLDAEEAIARASVVIDCTPKGVGHQNKARYYERFQDSVLGFLAQGSEDGFGLKYARGINDEALVRNDGRFVQIVSCNTHNIATLTKTLGFHDGEPVLEEGRFVCIRRASDISQNESFIAAPEVGKHSRGEFGTHHAQDAVRLFETIDYRPNLFSSAMKVNSQYMHVVWFDLRVRRETNLEEVKEKMAGNPLVAMTEKLDTCTVFSFGRDHGHFGRILNQTVVAAPTLTVHGGKEIVGYCFTPQDGNSLLSSIAAVERFLYPDSWEKRIQCLSHLVFAEV